MALSCGQLKRGLPPVCEPAAGGLSTKLVLIRKDDIVSATRNATVRKGVALALADTKKGFLFQGLADSNTARVTLSPGKYGPKYNHEIDFATFANTPENVETIEDLAKDKVVGVILANDGYYKIYGLGAGLGLSKDTSDTSNEDLGAGSEQTLSSTKEGGREDFLMVFDVEGNYDPAATKALFDSFYDVPVAA